MNSWANRRWLKTNKIIRSDCLITFMIALQPVTPITELSISILTLKVEELKFEINIWFDMN